MQTKTCPTCKIEKTLENYNKNKNCKDSLQRECRECCHSHHDKHYHSKKSPRLKEDLKEGHKICSSCNEELPLVDFTIQKTGRFGVNNTCKICSNLKWNEYQKRTDQNNTYNKHRKATDPQFKLKSLIRGRFLDAVKRHTRGGKVNKKHSALTILGCGIEEYKLFLENKFKPDMTWENHGKLWEIDHIIPCSKFDLTNLEQQKQCFNYLNTQPLYKSENRSKGDR